jgi:hypothetical protein
MGKYVLTILVSLAVLLNAAGTLHAIVPTTDNIAYIEQVGSYNEAVQTQTGQSNYAATIQQLEENFAKIIQQGDWNNPPSIPVPSSENPGFIAYWPTDPAGPGGAVWFQYQNGIKNSVDIDIMGDSNGARQWQDGSNNTATIEIIGNNNAAQQVQLNGGNNAEVYIYANNSTVSQYQWGGQDSKITVTGDGWHLNVTGNTSGIYPPP